MDSKTNSHVVPPLKIEIAEHAVTVNGIRFDEPPTVGRLSEILGPPTDTRTISVTASQVWQWSEMGIQLSGRSEHNITAFSLFIDSNLQGSKLDPISNSKHHYIIRYSGRLIILGIDAAQPAVIENLKQNAIVQNRVAHTGGDHTTATYWFSGGKSGFSSASSEDNQLYLCEEEYSDSGKPVFYNILTFSYEQRSVSKIEASGVKGFQSDAPLNIADCIDTLTKCYGTEAIPALRHAIDSARHVVNYKDLFWSDYKHLKNGNFNLPVGHPIEVAGLSEEDHILLVKTKNYLIGLLDVERKYIQDKMYPESDIRLRTTVYVQMSLGGVVSALLASSILLIVSPSAIIDKVALILLFFAVFFGAFMYWFINVSVAGSERRKEKVEKEFLDLSPSKQLQELQRFKAATEVKTSYSQASEAPTKLIPCPSCEQMVSPNSVSCVGCGEPIAKPNTERFAQTPAAPNTINIHRTVSEIAWDETIRMITHKFWQNFGKIFLFLVILAAVIYFILRSH